MRLPRSQSDTICFKLARLTLNAAPRDSARRNSRPASWSCVQPWASRAPRSAELITGLPRLRIPRFSLCLVNAVNGTVNAKLFTIVNLRLHVLAGVLVWHTPSGVSELPS
ncbi:hypothetical protein GCM10009772_43230 [Pseudonocardia alni subsp. carboxydivorans]